MADPKSILMALAREQAQNLNSSPFSQAVNSDITRNANAVASALMAPGNALRGEYSQTEIEPSGYVRPFSGGLMDAASNMAGVVSLGSVPMARPVGSLGMGGAPRPPQTIPLEPRPHIPSNPNYIRGLDTETPFLHREMNAERANQLIEGNIRAPWGQERMYWSDVPELAKGQGGNTGVTMTMASEGVMGKADLSSKPGLQFVKATGGGKEYVTTDGVNFSKVNEIKVSPAVNEYGSPDDRRLLLRLRHLVESGQFEPSYDGFITTYKRVVK